MRIERHIAGRLAYTAVFTNTTAGVPCRFCRTHRYDIENLPEKTEADKERISALYKQVGRQEKQRTCWGGANMELLGSSMRLPGYPVLPEEGVVSWACTDAGVAAAQHLGPWPGVCVQHHSMSDSVQLSRTASYRTASLISSIPAPSETPALRTLQSAATPCPQALHMAAQHTRSPAFDPPAPVPVPPFPAPSLASGTASAP